MIWGGVGEGYVDGPRATSIYNIVICFPITNKGLRVSCSDPEWGLNTS